MGKKDNRPEQANPLANTRQALRLRAEEMAHSPEDLKAMSPEETQQTLHELRVHQIELEMQNEELKRVQAELDAARARYFDLYDLAPVGYCTISEKGLIMEANLTAATLLGVSRGALTKQPISRFILKEDQDIYYLHIKQLFGVGEPQACELRMVKMDGTVFWAHLVDITLQDADGAPVCRVVLNDITRRKQVEEELRESEEKYRIANKELAFQNEEKDKRAAELAIANKELAFQNEEKDKRAAELAIANKELAFQNEEKDKRAAELAIANKELAFQKEALKQSEEKYRSLVENLHDVIFTVNAEGYVTYISPVVERLAAYKALEIIGKLFMSYIHPEDQHGLLENFRRTLSGQIEPAEFRLLRKDGTSIYVRALNRALAENGQVSLTGVLSDITERKKAEDELRESHTKLVKTLDQTVVSLASIAEMRDPYTAGHQVRVASLACEIASEIGMSTEQMSAIRTAALLHDIGKIIVPSEILNKPGKLNALERSFVDAHAQASYEILKTIEFEFPIAEIILQHHEKLDGSGYPRGLSGDSILKEARVLAVADVIEAMASYRPYRPALPLKVALEEIDSHRGTLYDADVVDACLRLFSRKGFAGQFGTNQESIDKA
jgi:PAS domain S-box-containing protein/putative nucleotidyltransferase with HDIG domain